MLRALLRNRWAARAAVVLLVVIIASEVAALTRDDGRPAAAAADVTLARRFAVAATSFDHKRIDADVRRVFGFGTPGLEAQFRRAMGAEFIPTFVANKAVSRGHVTSGPRAHVVTDERATFVVAVDQEVTSEAAPGPPHVTRVGMLVTVDRKAHKVSKLELL